MQSPLLWHCIPTPGTVSPSNPSNRRWNMAASSALCSDSSRDSPEWWCWVSQTCVVENKAAQSTTVKSKRRWHFRLEILHCSIFVLHDQKFEGFFLLLFLSLVFMGKQWQVGALHFYVISTNKIFYLQRNLRSLEIVNVFCLACILDDSNNDNNSLCSHLLALGGALAVSSAAVNKRAASFQSRPVCCQKYTRSLLQSLYTIQPFHCFP